MNILTLQAMVEEVDLLEKLLVVSVEVVVVEVLQKETYQ